MPRAKSVNENGTEQGTARKTSAIPLSVPVEFKTILEDLAKERNTSVAGLVRNELAKLFNYTLPPLVTRQRGKYAGMSADEKKAAIAAEQKKTRDNVKALLARMEAGNMSWEDVLAKFGPSQPAPEQEPVTA